MIDILIIMNNYFHDVATALLLASAVILWILGRRAEELGGDAATALAQAYPTLTKFALGALTWIIIGGVPRTIFFTRYEWDPADVKGLLPALGVKHALMFLAVVVGSLMWRRMARVAKNALTDSEA